jgi:ATP adenylyltransferase
MEGRPLWAPWRIEYIKGPKPDRCIFCAASASADDAQALVVDRGERCLTMLNTFPYAGGHLMVAPHRHVGELEACELDELTELMAVAQRAIRALRAVSYPDGFNVGMNLGTAAGAGFADHLHLHVVPRWEGDTNYMPVLAGTHVVPQALDETRAALARALGDLE